MAELSVSTIAFGIQYIKSIWDWQAATKWADKIVRKNALGILNISFQDKWFFFSISSPLSWEQMQNSLGVQWLSPMKYIVFL